MVLNQPLIIDKLHLNNRCFLAPLAGITDVPFRRICQEYGAGLTFVEMISCVALLYNNKKTLDMLHRHKSENVLGIQLVGTEPEDFFKACKVLQNYDFEIIDLNMGCPARKVVGSGGGSALLQFPEKISEIVTQARSATVTPLSVKYRLGYTRQYNVTDVTTRIVTAGVSMITIHGRTRQDEYSVPVDPSGIALGFQHGRSLNPGIVTIANGDIFNVKDALQRQEQTSSDGIMVARGALGNPWIFKELQQGMSYDVTLEEWQNTVARHIAYQQEEYPQEEFGATLLRKYLLWYAKGFRGAKELRLQWSQIKDYHEAYQILRNFCNTLPPDTIRVTK